MRRIPCLILIVMAALVAGCGADKASHVEYDVAAAAGGASKSRMLRDSGPELAEANYSRHVVPMERRPNDGEQAMLAYEHDVEIRMDADKIAPKVKVAKQACETGKFGACLVLGVDQSGGRYPRASLRVRAEPKAIEPLIAAAGEGGDIGDRSTRAEDLAVAVRDNTLLRSRLSKQHARLLEFQGRSDLKVADVIALSEQLSKVEAELEAAEREGAIHKRRIETQLLTIELSPHISETGRSEVAIAFGDSGRVMASSTAGVIRIVAGLLPVLLALALAIWLLRRLIRFLHRRKAAKD